MNLQQLEYAIALAREKSFSKAAAACFVTQATLSMMIKKLEHELGVLLFDRSKLPISVTPHGQVLIDQTQRILVETKLLQSKAAEIRGDVFGEVKIGIIPTLAPYLLPLFIKPLCAQFPLLRVDIKDLITDDIIEQLKKGDLDVGLCATPLNEPGILEEKLFYEEFLVYAASSEHLPNKKYVLPEHINPEHLWLLEEGHCMRNQLINICQLQEDHTNKIQFHYRAGSIETLINLVDHCGGITIIPKLTTLGLSRAQRSHIRPFNAPQPVREISIVYHQNNPKTKLMKQMKNSIMNLISTKVPSNLKGLRIVEID
ncbi:MAG: hydrogen peroxide-inducible genes activator [Saprospiraceae bacterium]|nr:hydrogen peroxide-inducible genes activator [Saprospiraceae bacterium]